MGSEGTLAQLLAFALFTISNASPTFQANHICHSQVDNVWKPTCPFGTVIRIVDAFYGQIDGPSSVCTNSDPDAFCMKSVDVKHEVWKVCEGEERCTVDLSDIENSTHNLTAVCPGVEKYTRVRLECWKPDDIPELPIIIPDFALEHGHVYQRISRLHRQWSLELEIKPHSYTNNWGSVVHVTTGSNCCSYGQRTPGVWFYAWSRGLYLSSAINGDGNYLTYQNDRPYLPWHVWTRLEISQFCAEEETSCQYTIRLNGTIWTTLINEQPQSFEDVIVYAADPWHTSAAARVRNLLFTTYHDKALNVPVTTPKCNMTVFTKGGNFNWKVLSFPENIQHVDISVDTQPTVSDDQSIDLLVGDGDGYFFQLGLNGGTKSVVWDTRGGGILKEVEHTLEQYENMKRFFNFRIMKTYWVWPLANEQETIKFGIWTHDGRPFLELERPTWEIAGLRHIHIRSFRDATWVLNSDKCKRWNMVGGFNPVPGYIHETIPTLFNQWYVSFELHSLEQAVVTNSLSDKISGNVLKIGDVLSVNIVEGWLHFANKGRVMNIRAVEDHQYHNWAKVEVSQMKMEDDVYQITIRINGEVMYHDVAHNVHDVQSYNNVNVYFSSPTEEAANVKVDKIRIQTWPEETNVRRDGGKKLGGCKEFSTKDDLNVHMLCKKKCSLKDIGRGPALKLKMLMSTKTNVMAQITVGVKSIQPYVGILRLEEKFCSTRLLDAISNNGNVRFDVGDKTEPNYWMESISYIENVGEPPSKRAVFVQFRRGKKIAGEMIKGKKDVVLISLTSFDGSFSKEELELCLAKTHLSFMKNDKQLPYSNDYTRCAAFNNYALKPSWSEREFLPAIGIWEAKADSVIGGCKAMTTAGREKGDFKCATECKPNLLGVVKDMDFELVLKTESNVVAEISVEMKGDKGLIRFDAQHCRHRLLLELVEQRTIRFDIAEAALESLTYPYNVGENAKKRALFVQFSKKEFSSQKVVLLLKSFAREKMDFLGFSQDDLLQCVSEASVFSLEDEGSPQTDFTRCAAFKHYGVEVNWDNSHFLSTYPTTTTTTTNPLIPHGVKCNAFSGNSGKIGIGGKIVGGVEAVPHSWPWIARMEFSGSAGCAGSILAPNWILTAAHCCDYRSGVTFLVGDHSYSTNEGSEQRVKAQEVYMHPLYDDYYDYYYDEMNDKYIYNYDFCLVRVENITLDGVTADVVCLPEPNEHVNANDGGIPGGPSCFVGGWGSTRQWTGPDDRKNGHKAQSDTLQSVNVNIFSTAYCEAKTWLDGRFDPATEFCAGNMDGGIDSCQGDSGGPLICISEDNEPILYGVVSWGYGCARPNLPGLYAKVSSVVGWIWNTIYNETIYEDEMHN